MFVDFLVDLSTTCRMKNQPNRQDKQANRRIVGFSLSPDMAADVKAEAAKRGISLRKLFEEMWSEYNMKKAANNARKS